MYLDKEVKEFLNSIDENGLYLISLPTGFGKTKGVNDFIKENEKVVYTTHLKHLINELDGFDFVLKSDIETLRENIPKVKRESFIYKLKSFKNVKNYINVLGEEELNNRFIPALKNDLREIYKKDKSIIDEVEVLFPSVKIEKYKKIATTSHKFVRGFFHFENGSFLSENFKDFFIFIDEFNIQKKVFLDALEFKSYEVIELYRSFKNVLSDGFLQKYGVSEKITKDIKKKFRKKIPQFVSREDFKIKSKKEVNIISDRFLIENYYNDMKFLKDIKSAINSFLGITKEIYKRNQNLLELTQSVTTKEPTRNHTFVKEVLIKNLPTKPLISTTSLEDLYNDGFNHLCIKKEEGLDEFIMSGISKTPERFIKELAKNSKVVGISATALIKSVVRNFDLDYLEVKKIFSKEVKIKDNTEIRIIKPVKEVDDRFLMDELDLKEEYLKRRFLNFYKVYEEFLKSDMKSFLYLESEYLDNKFSFLIERVKEKLNKKYNKQCDIFILKNKNEYKEFVKGKDKFFVISTYQNVGAGANLNYENRDIDGVYLGDITNLIDFNNKNAAIYILLSFYKKHLISKKDLKVSLKSLMTSKKPEIKIISRYKKTDDYVNAIMEIVIQAIGRLYRVDKEAKKFVFINEKLAEKIKYFHYEGALLPVIRKLCLKKEKKENFEEAVKNNEYARKKINYLLSAIDFFKEEWKEIREYIFLNPSVDDPKYKLFYASLPNRYYYRQSGDYSYVRISEEKRDGYIEFSKRKIYPEILEKLFGFEFDFEKEYKLIPIAWNNIFKGVLGEKVVEETFRRFGVELKSLDANFEEFDFQTDGYFIDAKNLSQINIEEMDYEKTIRKYQKRLNKLKGKRGFIINIFGYTPEYKRYEIQEFGNIAVIPYLIDVKEKNFNPVAVEYLKGIFYDKQSNYKRD
jgi:hypothetical protein